MSNSYMSWVSCNISDAWYKHRLEKNVKFKLKRTITNIIQTKEVISIFIYLTIVCTAKMVADGFQVRKRCLQIVHRRDNYENATRPSVHHVQVPNNIQQRIRTDRTLYHRTMPRTDDVEVIIHYCTWRYSSNAILQCLITKFQTIKQLRKHLPKLQSHNVTVVLVWGQYASATNFFFVTKPFQIRIHNLVHIEKFQWMSFFINTVATFFKFLQIRLLRIPCMLVPINIHNVMLNIRKEQILN